MKPRSGKSQRDRLLKWVDRFRDVPVLVIGDLMVDWCFRGPAERISPEAPVPVIHVQENSFTPGGAGNVVNNLSVLGARPTLASVRGDDDQGQQIIADLHQRGVDVTSIYVDPHRPTITKNRVFAGHQQVARFDFEKRGGIPEPIYKQLLACITTLVPKQKAIVISDYGKGIVTPAIINACLNVAQRSGIPVIVDPKIEHFMQYKHVDCITPNTKEAVEGMRAFAPKSELELLALGNRILNRLKSKSLLITRGEKGMTLFERNKQPRTIPALAQEVYDVTGAGDTVVSTFAIARAVGAPYFEAAQIANIAASVVVAKVGTAVVSRDELADRIKATV